MLFHYNLSKLYNHKHATMLTKLSLFNESHF